MSVFVCLVFFKSLNVYVLAARITYDRETLLDIRKQPYEPTFNLLDLDNLLHLSSNQRSSLTPESGEQRGQRREKLKRRRGKRGGLHARLKARTSRPPLPSLLLANVRSLENKMDELRTRIISQREIRDCCVLIFTETWLSDNTPDSAVQLQTHSIQRGNRTAASGKHKGGGICIYINNQRCSDVQIVSKHCSIDVEILLLKCRPFYLPREFTAVFFLGVYIPPHANSAAALGTLYDAINTQENTHPDAVFIVAGDFNHCDVWTVMPS